MQKNAKPVSQWTTPDGYPEEWLREIAGERESMQRGVAQCERRIAEGETALKQAKTPEERQEAQDEITKYRRRLAIIHEQQAAFEAAL